jgi:PAS domain-containing protein
MERSRSKAAPPGLRALEASGDGHWEIDLSDGSTWFSAWFATRLAWTESNRVQKWSALRPVMRDDTWNGLLRDMRQHLEEHAPLDREFEVRVASGEARWWRIRGCAERNAQRQPVHLAGSIQDVSEERAHRISLDAELKLLRSGFEALPAAAAILSAEGRILRVNGRWQALADSDPRSGSRYGVDEDFFDFVGTAAAARLKALAAEPGAECSTTFASPRREGIRRLRLRARAFDAAGPKLVVTQSDAETPFSEDAT